MESYLCISVIVVTLVIICAIDITCLSSRLPVWHECDGVIESMIEQVAISNNFQFLCLQVDFEIFFCELQVCLCGRHDLHTIARKLCLYSIVSGLL